MKKEMHFKKSCLVVPVLLLQFFFICSHAQCPKATDIDKQLKETEANTALRPDQKLSTVLGLKQQFEQCGLVSDSVQARLLHRIGYLQYVINNNIVTPSVIENTMAAIRINTSGSRHASEKFAVNSYNNMAYFYFGANQYSKALPYFDSVILRNAKYPNQPDFTLNALSAQAYMYIKRGDYQKDREVSTLGINLSQHFSDTFHLAELYIYRSFGYNFEGLWQPALQDANTAALLASRTQNESQLTDAIKLKAISYAGLGEFDKADKYFTEALHRRKQEGEDGEIKLATDYLDYGNYFLNNRQNYQKAVDCYEKTISLSTANHDNGSLSQAYTNLAQAGFRYHRLEASKNNYYRAFRSLNIPAPPDFLQNTSTKHLSQVADKDLLLVFLNNKTEVLLSFYKETGDKKWLRSCLQTAMVTDSVITQTRHEQLGEQSKLYWRNKTHQFFALAIEASYLANDAAKAFYFMEKSRSVLLYDKLNELGATAHLPQNEKAHEETLQIKLLEQQQKLSQLSPGSAAYNSEQAIFLQTKNNLERFIRSLENQYPIYYQYKYADKVPGLPELQSYLSINHQDFIHYFIGDTALYALGISGNGTKMIKVPASEFNESELSRFLRMCSQKESLNSQFAVFAALSHHIYNQIFLPLQVHKGNVAICTDQFFIPFEALSSDKDATRYLLYDYAFAYVYSARTLMRPFHEIAATGNFLGFAPVSFDGPLHVLNLSHSADALKQSAGYYSNDKVFTREEATRGNFFRHASDYSVLTVFSHALADTTGKEPVLYMRDSLIGLSELQRLKKPAVQLVILSACQTNIGKNATGEGIYSLARGFASVGIPAVSATLWKADERSIYQISARFNEYLSKGMNKSEALQKAKIWYLQNNSEEQTLPFYWANLVLIGNAQPIDLIKQSSGWWIGIMIAIALLLILSLWMVARKKEVTRHHPKNYFISP